MYESATVLYQAMKAKEEEEAQKALEEASNKWKDINKKLEENAVFLRKTTESQTLVGRIKWLEQQMKHLEWKGLQSQLVETTAKAQNIRQEITTASAVAERKRSQQEATREREETIEILQSRMELLVAFRKRFVGERHGDGFKSHVYRDLVLPLIQREVNDFISTVDSFQLSIRLRDNQFMFFLEDRGSSPTLDHASGYQRFVVGLAMRVALARIGVVGQNVKHLFIDEGFVACDSDNITKTSDILKEMFAFGGYRSMILMSHVEAIREIAEIHIPILRERGNKASLIQWGGVKSTKAAAIETVMQTEEKGVKTLGKTKTASSVVRRRKVLDKSPVVTQRLNDPTAVDGGGFEFGESGMVSDDVFGGVGNL